MKAQLLKGLAKTQEIVTRVTLDATRYGAQPDHIIKLADEVLNLADIVQKMLED